MTLHAFNLGNMLWSGPLGPLRYPEVSITGAITLDRSAWNRMHVCSGTSADYAVTLPPVSGNAGNLLGFRMAAGLTKFVTLDGNASELIDSVTTRVAWAGETALLLCDGSNWFKIAGKPRPLFAQGERSTGVTIATSTITHIPINVVLNESYIGLVDTGGSPAGVIRIKRTGLYNLQAFLSFEIIGSALLGFLGYCIIGVNSITAVPTSPGALAIVPTAAEGANTVDQIMIAEPRMLTAGDYVSLMTYQNTGVSATTRIADGFKPILSVLEVPSW